MVENTFTDLNVQDVEVGAALFKSLQLYPVSLTDPQVFGKMKEIVDYLNEDIDALWTIETISRGNKNPKISALDNMYNYVQLQKQRKAFGSKLQQIEKELSNY